MTMVICKECKGHISTLAMACLHCGANRRKPRHYATVAITVLGLAVLANTWMLWRLYDSGQPVTSGDIARSTQASE